MMKHLLTIATFSITSCLLAQPTLTSHFLPAPGVLAELERTGDLYIMEGPDGANQTWDFSLILTSVSNEEHAFMDPANTPFDTLYPTATLAALNPDTSYSYFMETPGDMVHLGLAKDQPGFGVVYSDYNSDPELIISFPYQYQYMSNTSFSGTTYAGGFSTSTSGTKTIEADAWGTLILPNGTFMNTLRLHETRSETTTGFTANGDIYRWVSADHLYWLLELGSYTNSLGGANWINRYAESPLQVGIVGTAVQNPLNILNTVVDQGQPVRIWSWEPVQGDLFMTDMTGKRVFERLRLNLGRDGMTINSSALSAGVYIIGFATANGVTTERIVVR